MARAGPLGAVPRPGDGAAARGLKVGFSPSATKLVTRARIEHVRDSGVDMVHISLDGSCPDVHDSFRRVDGALALAGSQV